jgi:hypothetical protein
MKFLVTVLRNGIPDQWKELIIVPVHEAIKLTVVIIVGYHCCQLRTVYPISLSQGEVHI